MGKAEIEVIDITSRSEWREVCKKVREACEIHGCFLIKNNNEIIPQKLHEDMVISIKSLFDLPEETKNKYINPKPYRSYTSNSSSSSSPDFVPSFQSFGIDHPHHFDVIHSFTNLMWPQGNNVFSESVHKMSMKMLEVNNLVMKMIFESFGIEKHYESHIKDSISLMRITKYVSPASGDVGESAVALPAHTDKNAITILCQNQVQGLELQTQDGQWAQVFVPQHSLVVIVGEALKVWSNGRLKAARHRVVMRGGKEEEEEERYSWGVFSMPKEESRIEVPLELVDKDHPLLYKPFIFSDYLSFFVSKLSDDALDLYAAL